MLAALTFDRDPLQFNDLPTMINHWVQTVGGFAAFCILLWVVFHWLRLVRVDQDGTMAGRTRVVILVAAVLYLLRLGRVLINLPALLDPDSQVKEAASPTWDYIQSLLMTIGGSAALLVVAMPLLGQLPKFRLRRIGAVAKLSFTEALRRRVPFIFALVLLIFLFANWYVISKPEDQVRTYVSLTFDAMGPLLIAAALILGAFSLPTDMKQQTIHTVLTKPVYRFEVVLGRFLGFVGLLTVILVIMTTLSLIYVLRNVDPAAATESLKARSPAYGELVFEGTGNDSTKGESVGREWGYRSYIGKQVATKPQQYAIWKFAALPASVADRPTVRCEFTFDIYRLTKGKENEGVGCNFLFTTANYRRGNERLGNELRAALKGTKSAQEIDSEVAEKFGYFQVDSKDITDFHTQWIDVPGGLFRNALKPAPQGPAPSTPSSPIEVRVSNTSEAGHVGMARYDLYFRLDDPAGPYETLWFALNFFKASFGIWCQMVLVCGLATALSTYLSGVISLLITCLFYFGGLFQEFIETVATGKNIGGGPIEAMFRIATGKNLNAPMEQGTITTLATTSDVGFRWMIGRLLDILPDVDRFYLNNYVSEGFDLPFTQIILTAIVLLGYLLPWALLSFYLIRWREIASQT